MYMDGVVQVYVRVNACGVCFIYVVVSIYIYIYSICIHVDLDGRMMLHCFGMFCTLWELYGKTL